MKALDVLLECIRESTKKQNDQLTHEYQRVLVEMVSLIVQDEQLVSKMIQEIEMTDMLNQIAVQMLGTLPDKIINLQLKRGDVLKVFKHE